MKKKILLLGVFGLLIPLNIKALSGSATISCDKKGIKAGEITNCKLSGNTDIGITTIDATIELGDNLTITSITKDAGWQGETEVTDSKVELYTEDDKSGNFNIVDFKIKANADANAENSIIRFKNIQFGVINSSIEATYDIPDAVLNLYSEVETQKKNIIVINGVNVELLDNVNEYNVELPYSQEKLKMEATLQDGLTINSEDIKALQDSPLKVGLNTVTFRIKNISNEEATYKINITRKDEEKTSTSQIKPSTPNNPETGNRTSIMVVSLMLLGTIAGLCLLTKNKYSKKI